VSAVRQGAGAVVVSNLDWLKSAAQFSGAVILVGDTLGALQTLGRNIRQKFKGKVVGITGSNGKTTTKNMLAGILKLTGPGLATQGNFNSQIGLPLVLSELQPADGWMVLEMGASEPGNIHHLAEIALPQIGIITGIGPAHLATFGSLARIARTKWELMEVLPKDGCAVLPWGEPSLEPHIRTFTKKIIYFGEDSTCVVRASSIEVGEKIKFQIHISDKSAAVSLPIGGRFNVKNALAAAGAAWVMGIPVDTIAQGISQFIPPPMRMEMLNHFSGAVLINDAYNANPASMMNSVLSFMESFPEKRKILVVGSMLELGSDSEKLHFHVGTELGRCPLEKIFLFGDETEAIKEGAAAAGAAKDRFIRLLNLNQIKDNLAPLLNSHTAVLFKGSRGMSLEKVVFGLFQEKSMERT
jgi:UDP-N-acetylmuramoyl-tripeptide--D-alanyl-D-alanine ligase